MRTMKNPTTIVTASPAVTPAVLAEGISDGGTITAQSGESSESKELEQVESTLKWNGSALITAVSLATHNCISDTKSSLLYLSFPMIRPR